MVTGGMQADRGLDEAELASLHVDLVRWLDRRSSPRLRSARAAEDAVQQAWLKLLERRRAGAEPQGASDGAACRQWLVGVARWELLRDDTLRGAPCVELDDEVSEAVPVPSRIEQVEYAHAVLRALSGDDRIVLLLRTWFDVPFDTIALALDCSSIHAARCALSRAMARARRIHARPAVASAGPAGLSGDAGAAARASRRNQPRSKRASNSSSGSNTRSQS